MKIYIFCYKLSAANMPLIEQQYKDKLLALRGSRSCPENISYEEMIDLLSSYDPTPKKIYLEWIIQQLVPTYNSETKQLETRSYWEDLSRLVLHESPRILLLEQYDLNKDKLDPINKDIKNIKSFSSLAVVVDSILHTNTGKGITINDDFKKYSEEPYSTVVSDSKLFKIFKYNGRDAAIYWSRLERNDQGSWCTGWNTTEHYNRYIRAGELFVIIDYMGLILKDGNIAKYAFHLPLPKGKLGKRQDNPGYIEVQDKNDELVPIRLLNSNVALLDQIENSPVLKKYIEDSYIHITKNTDTSSDTLAFNLEHKKVASLIFPVITAEGKKLVTKKAIAELMYKDRTIKGRGRFNRLRQKLSGKDVIDKKDYIDNKLVQLNVFNQDTLTLLYLTLTKNSFRDKLFEGSYNIDFSSGLNLNKSFMLKLFDTIYNKLVSCTDQPISQSIGTYPIEEVIAKDLEKYKEKTSTTDLAIDKKILDRNIVYKLSPGEHTYKEHKSTMYIVCRLLHLHKSNQLDKFTEFANFLYDNSLLFSVVDNCDKSELDGLIYCLLHVKGKSTKKDEDSKDRLHFTLSDLLYETVVFSLNKNSDSYNSYSNMADLEADPNAILPKHKDYNYLYWSLLLNNNLSIGRGYGNLRFASKIVKEASLSGINKVPENLYTDLLQDYFVGKHRNEIELVENGLGTFLKYRPLKSFEDLSKKLLLSPSVPLSPNNYSDTDLGDVDNQENQEYQEYTKAKKVFDEIISDRYTAVPNIERILFSVCDSLNKNPNITVEEFFGSSINEYPKFDQYKKLPISLLLYLRLSKYTSYTYNNLSVLSSFVISYAIKESYLNGTSAHYDTLSSKDKKLCDLYHQAFNIAANSFSDLTLTDEQIYALIDSTRAEIITTTSLSDVFGITRPSANSYWFKEFVNRNKNIPKDELKRVINKLDGMNQLFIDKTKPFLIKNGFDADTTLLLRLFYAFYSSYTSTNETRPDTEMGKVYAVVNTSIYDGGGTGISPITYSKGNKELSVVDMLFGRSSNQELNTRLTPEDMLRLFRMTEYLPHNANSVLYGMLKSSIADDIIIYPSKVRLDVNLPIIGNLGRMSINFRAAFIFSALCSLRNINNLTPVESKLVYYLSLIYGPVLINKISQTTPNLFKQYYENISPIDDLSSKQTSKGSILDEVTGLTYKAEKILTNMLKIVHKSGELKTPDMYKKWLLMMFLIPVLKWKSPPPINAVKNFVDTGNTKLLTKFVTSQETATVSKKASHLFLKVKPLIESSKSSLVGLDESYFSGNKKQHDTFENGMSTLLTILENHNKSNIAEIEGEFTDFPLGNSITKQLPESNIGDKVHTGGVSLKRMGDIRDTYVSLPFAD